VRCGPYGGCRDPANAGSGARVGASACRGAIRVIMPMRRPGAPPIGAHSPRGICRVLRSTAARRGSGREVEAHAALAVELVPDFAARFGGGLAAISGRRRPCGHASNRQPMPHASRPRPERFHATVNSQHRLEACIRSAIPLFRPRSANPGGAFTAPNFFSHSSKRLCRLSEYLSPRWTSLTVPTGCRAPRPPPPYDSSRTVAQNDGSRYRTGRSATRRRQLIDLHALHCLRLRAGEWSTRAVQLDEPRPDALTDYARR